MNNSITLYKSEYTPSSPRQPYFKTIEGRNNYLKSIESKELELIQPQIVIGSSLNINIVAPIDISEIEEYTLAKIIYNNKEYFIYVLDTSMISVGNTRIYGHRSVSFECVNYFNKFKNFDINRITTDNLFFGLNSRFQIPALKLSQSSESAIGDLTNDAMPATLMDSNITYSFDKVEHCLFMVACVSESVSEKGNEFIFQQYNFDGLCAGFSILLVPILDVIRNELGNFKIAYYSNANGYKYAAWDTAYFVNKFLSAISPYLLNVAFIRLPVYSYKNGNKKIVMLPYESWLYEWTSDTGHKVQFCAISGRLDLKPFDYILSTKVDPNRIYGKYTIQLYGEHDINLDLSRYLLQDGAIRLIFKVKYIFDTHGISIMLESELPDYGKRIENYKEQYIYKISAGVTFFISAKADFLAQNKYYEAITENETQYIKIKGNLGAASSATTGITQTGIAAIEMGASDGKAGWGGISNGVSNMIRGYYQALETIEDASHYEMQRFYYALNEQSKPDTEKDNVESGYILCASEFDIIRYIYSEPFETDFKNFYQRSQIYGVDCNIFCETYEEFSSYFRQEFSVSMIMYQNENNHYSNMQNNEIKELTRSGLLYRIYD